MIMRANRTCNGNGFTLIEIVVAMAIIAVGMLVAMDRSNFVVRNTTAMQGETFAQWVAINKVNELKLKKTWPAVGESTGEEKLAGIEWKWKAKVQSTPDNDIRKVEVSVSLASDENENPYANVTAFIGRNL